MIAPIRDAIANHHGLDVWVQEYRSGYGIADLVGMVMSKPSYQMREQGAQRLPLDNRWLMEVLLQLSPKKGLTFETLVRRVALAPSTLRNKVIRVLSGRGLVVERGGRYCLTARLSNPAAEIVAVEAKIDRWPRAILQARRYRLFAQRSYVAVAMHVVPRVDRWLLYRHRIGLIGVEDAEARIIIEAPRSAPRDICAHRVCAESLYSQALASVCKVAQHPH